MPILTRPRPLAKRQRLSTPSRSAPPPIELPTPPATPDPSWVPEVPVVVTPPSRARWLLEWLGHERAEAEIIVDRLIAGQAVELDQVDEEHARGLLSGFPTIG